LNVQKRKKNPKKNQPKQKGNRTMRTPKVGRGNFPQPPTGDVNPGDEWYEWCVDVWAAANPAGVAKEYNELPKIFKVQEGEIKLVGALPEFHPLGTGCLFVKLLGMAVVIVSVIGTALLFTNFYDVVSPTEIMFGMIFIALALALWFARKI